MLRTPATRARRWRGLLSLALLVGGWLLTLAACGGGGSTARNPASSTLAYVVTECSESRDGTFFNQRLQVQRGDGAPLTVVQTPTLGPLPPIGLCKLFGRGHQGSASVFGGAFQRLGVTPDGTGVVFEVSDDFSFVSESFLPPDQKGIFFVRADGSGLRRLGPASREMCCGAFSGGGSFGPYFNFSPDGQSVAFADLAPDASGAEVVQVITQDVATGQRTQVTRLPPAADPSQPAACCPSFLTDRTLSFFSVANPDGLNPEGNAVEFTVSRDGSDLTPLSLPVAIPGSQVLTGAFFITGAQREVVVLLLPGTPANPSSGFTSITEVFVDDGKNLLQLTDFHRVDTIWAILSSDRQRVFFAASADPFGTNPSANCQLFSIDVLGGGLRQLTNFRQAARSTTGCLAGAPPGCYVAFNFDPPQSRDAATGALVFDSSCDPLGTNPNGDQIFTMRPDGSGLRQLTNTHGTLTAADGSVTVELPGPWGYGPYR